MTTQTTINIAKDFSDVPSGRYRTDGPASGESFREDVLKVALESFDQVIIELDGTEGYGSSFLEEAFGGLVRKKYLSNRGYKSKLTIIAQADAYKHYQAAAYSYIEKAVPEN